MIRGATSKLAAALGLAVGKECATGREVGESAPVQVIESANVRIESEKSRAVDQAAPVESLARARTGRRSLPTRVRKGNVALLRDFLVWLHENEVTGEIRAVDLFRCYVEFAKETGAAALTPRQLSIALGLLKIKKRRLRVRDRNSGRVAKLATGVPMRATRYMIPDQATTAAAPAESATATTEQTATGASAKIERAA